MTTPAPVYRQAARTPLGQAIAAVAVLLLWLVYTALQTLFVMQCLSEPIAALLGFLPGVLAVGALLAAGWTREACYLRLAALSPAGFWVLVGVAVFAFIAILPAGQWQGWHWTAALAYAPASGISQELFFRSGLLPVCQVMVKRRTAALTLHALLFGLWHIGPLFIGAPLWAVVAIMVVPFLCGIGWGWQVLHDGTVGWAMAQHSLIWAIGLQFAFPA